MVDVGGPVDVRAVTGVSTGGTAWVAVSERASVGVEGALHNFQGLFGYALGVLGRYDVQQRLGQRFAIVGGVTSHHAQLPGEDWRSGSGASKSRSVQAIQLRAGVRRDTRSLGGQLL